MSASTLERLDACPPSAILPQVVESGEEAAERGIGLHGFVRSVIAGVPREVAIAELADEDWRTTAALIDFNDLVGDLRAVRAEASYALDVRTGGARFIGLNRGRAYGPLGAWEVPGTDDYEGTSLMTGLPAVRDLKTGQPVTACRDNLQITFYARARMLTLRNAGVAVARVEARIDYLRASGRVEPDAHTFGAFELDDFGDRLRDIKERVEVARVAFRSGDVPTVYPGDHCTYCPALQACPAHIALIRTLATATHMGPVPLDEKFTLEDVVPLVAAVPSEERGRLLALTNRGIDALELIKKGFRTISFQEPVQLENGQVYGPGKPFVTERFAPEKAITLLRAKGATEEEIRALYSPSETLQVRARGKKIKTHLRVVA